MLSKWGRNVQLKCLSLILNDKNDEENMGDEKKEEEKKKKKVR